MDGRLGDSRYQGLNTLVSVDGILMRNACLKYSMFDIQHEASKWYEDHLVEVEVTCQISIMDQGRSHLERQFPALLFIHQKKLSHYSPWLYTITHSNPVVLCGCSDDHLPIEFARDGKLFSPFCCDQWDQSSMHMTKLPQTMAHKLYGRRFIMTASNNCSFYLFFNSS